MTIRRTTLLLFCIAFCIDVLGQAKPSSGSIRRMTDFQSAFVTNRNIDIWLPEGYPAKQPYNVLYMHDGQMLFDSASTWNHLSWDVDKTATMLMQAMSVRDFIVVGIWNGGETRHPDYFPQKPFESMSLEQQTFVRKQLQSGRGLAEFQPKSDNYLKFIVKELKPVIDRNYAVNKSRRHTFIAGSSMGGLISLYAICEYPGVFGGAICMSTHWPGIFNMENNPVPEAFYGYLLAHLPKPSSHKIYFDYGDKTLDALYPPLQKKVDEIMKSSGYSGNKWMTKFFPGKEHSETAWKERLAIPLVFMMGGK